MGGGAEIRNRGRRAAERQGQKRDLLSGFHGNVSRSQRDAREEDGEKRTRAGGTRPKIPGQASSLLELSR